jgi:GNAT superfamily N-acetyltransferase
MIVKLKKIIRKILKEEFEKLDNNYSGMYENLYNFIIDNKLQDIFVKKYSNFDHNLTLKNWNNFVRGEMGSDEEIIESLAGENHKVYYNEEEDSFTVVKKNKNALNYKIILSKNNEIINVLDKSGIYSEYEPRFAVISNNKIIGGSTYNIDEDNVYNFDIGILSKYQNCGISKKLISAIIEDAENWGANSIKAQVVNDALFNYLTNIGFSSSNDSGLKYVYKKL